MISAKIKKAFITGITGQDGSYLTELLLDQGYEVHGAVRRSSVLNRSRLDHLYSNADVYNKRLFLHYADIDDVTTLRRLLTKIMPSEVYHLAGQSHVGLSFDIPETTCEYTAMGTLRLLEILRDLVEVPRFFHPASSEIFGRPSQIPQTEGTAIDPVNPYGCAKAFATQMVRIYRETYGLFAVNGILYNHESPRRGENFVTRKICRAAAAIKLNQQSELILGDISAQRDWGHARDYVRGMWLTLQHSEPDDYIFATGRLNSVQDVIKVSFETVGLDWERYVKFDSPGLKRPTESMNLVGDPAKARNILDWAPSISFEELIREMTLAEFDALK